MLSKFCNYINLYILCEVQIMLVFCYDKWRLILFDFVEETNKKVPVVAVNLAIAFT